MLDVAELKPGDRYVHAGVIVTILRDREPWVDFFDREMFQYWATRSDTGAEGWVRFGPGGMVQVVAPVPCDWQTAYGLPWSETCGKPAEPWRLWCAEHCQDYRDNYPHLSLPRTN